MKSDFNHESHAYFPGWWDEFSYNDRNAYVDYSPEYLMSQNYYDSDKTILFEYVGNKSGNIAVDSKVNFPNQEGKEVCNFFDKYILKRVIKDLSEAFNCAFPRIKGLQFVTIYYDRAKKLSKHTDEVFLSAHLGPTDKGLFILPLKSGKPIPVSLDTGEILLFSGREFKYEMGLLDQKISSPLPHWAEAKKGRLTIALSTFVKSPR